MESWKVQQAIGCDFKITGDKLEDAIQRNLGDLYRMCGRKNIVIVQDRVECVIVEYKGDILGGNGGVEVEFVSKIAVRGESVYYDTLHRVVWIYADKEDLPSRLEFRGWKFI